MFKYAVFEPGTRNTGTAIAGKNIANPLAMLNASVDMLRHLGINHYADVIEDSIRKTITVDKIHTKGKKKKSIWGHLLGSCEVKKKKHSEKKIFKN